MVQVHEQNDKSDDEYGAKKTKKHKNIGSKTSIS